MPIRIVHTADSHIGMPFKVYQGAADVRARLVAERFAALGRLVETANDRKADFFVVAGDLFDSMQVKADDIVKTVGLLSGFTGTAVIVVPGNHDYVTGPETEVWKRFREASATASQIDLLTTPAVKSYEIDGQTVHFFPCPCPSKTGREPTIGWVAAAARGQTDGLRIGIAHGNVTGLGLDAADQYFTMSREALESAGVATWLLGHIHVPFPTTGSGIQSPYFMAGTHTPDSIRCRHPGSAWWIECEGNQVTRYERLSPGRIRFTRIERELLAADDVTTLLFDCRSLEAPATILDLQLSGRLARDERAALDQGIRSLEGEFLHVTHESVIHDRIDAAKVAETYRSGGLAERLITALLTDEDHAEAATLAHELIEEASKA
jgi:DNA repair exonuclease SbcCD nuclease subunit